MEGMFWLLMLCGLTVGILLTLALCRRMLSQDLPEDAILVVVLRHASENIPSQLEALAAQAAWMDSALLQQIWLIDGTESAQLETVCLAFCSTHPNFAYCPVGEAVKLSLIHI